MICNELNVLEKAIGNVIPVSFAPDWTTLDITSPYLKNDRYYIVVELKAEFINPNDIAASRLLAINSLFLTYNKKIEFSDFLLDKLIFEDKFIPSRPNLKCADDSFVFGAKILFSISARDLDAIENNTATQIESPPLARSEIQLFSDEIKPTIKKISFKINDNLIELFPFVLQNLFLANGLVFKENQQDLIILGLNENEEVIYVFVDDGKLTWLRFGFTQFKQTKPVRNKKIIKLLQHFDDFNQPNTDLSFLGNIQKPFNSINSIGKTIDDINSKSTKDEDEKEAEDEALNSTELKKTIVEENKSRVDFDGDVVLHPDNFNKILDKITSLEDVYTEFLNKTSITNLIQTAIKCLPLPEPCQIIIALLNNLPIDQLIPLLIEKAGINLGSIPELEPLLRIVAKDCLSSIAVNEQIKILNIISVKTNLRIDNIDSLQLAPIAAILEALNSKELIKQTLKKFNVGIKFERAPLKDFCVRLKLPNVDIDFNIDLDIRLPTIPDFTIPTINLNDLLPTIDIMASISLQIESTIIEALTAILVDTIKTIIRNFLENCGELPKNYGHININELLAKNLHVSVDSDVFASIKSNLFKNLDIPGFILLGKQIDAFLSELSTFITPAEIINLLNGNATPDVFKISNCLIATKHSGLKEALGDKDKFEQVFAGLGALTNKSRLLNQISEILPPEPQSHNSTFLCDDIIDANKRKLLSDKGLTPDEIDEQIALSNKLKQDHLNDLLDLLNNKNILDKNLPPLFCNKNSKGLINKNHPSFDHVLDKTVNTLYDNVHVSFIQEVANFPTILKETGTKPTPREIPNKISATDVDGNPQIIDNPEFTRLVAQGVAVKKDANDNILPILTYEDTSLQSGFVANGLKQNLETFETRNFEFNTEQIKFSLKIPNNLNTDLFVQSQNANSIDLQNQIGSLAQTSYEIDYLLPKKPNVEKDEYSILIKQISQSGEDNLFSFSSHDDLQENIKIFANDNHLNTFGNYSLPQSYFGSFVTKIIENGDIIYRDGNLINEDYANGISFPNNVENIKVILRDKIQKKLYSNAFRDLVALMARQVGNSQLFNINVLSLIDFTPDPHCPGKDLLNLDNVKKDMKDAFKNSNCSEDNFPTVDGLGKGSPSSLEQSGITGCVKTYIRLLTIESLLRSIFVLSEFKISELQKLDNSIVKYVSELVKKEVNSFDIDRDRFIKEIIKAGEASTLEESLDKLVSEQIVDVFQNICNLIGASGNINLERILVEEWLPLFEICDGSIRLVPEQALSIKKILSGDQRKDYNNNFNFENGNFILERYVRVKERNIDQKNKGVCNLNILEATTANLNLPDEFAGWSYGLRLVYVPPLGNYSVIPFTALPLLSNELFDGVFTPEASIKLNETSKINKSLRIFEGDNNNVSGQRMFANQPHILREINSIPIVSVEIEEKNFNGNFKENWNSHSKDLVQKMIDSNEFKFMFEYCFPMKRIISLLILYNNVYLYNLKKLKTLFNGTKTTLKTVFEALINAGNYKFDDSYIKNIGSTTGIMTKAQNNFNTESEIPGMSILAMAARTPILILKGLVELVDPNIAIARKVVDIAKANDKNIPIQAASLALLPMNVFPFSPGPPISPLGFFYLATNIDSVFDSAQGKDLKRKELKNDPNTKLDLTKVKGDC